MRIQLLPLVLGFAVLVLVTGARSYLSEIQLDNREAARETIKYQELLQGVLSLAQDAETGQRGYLLTDDAAYLRPYQTAVAALPGQFKQAFDLVGADAGRRADPDRGA